MTSFLNVLFLCGEVSLFISRSVVSEQWLFCRSWKLELNYSVFLARFLVFFGPNIYYLHVVDATSSWGMEFELSSVFYVNFTITPSSFFFLKHMHNVHARHDQ